MTKGFLVGLWHYIVPPEGLPVKVTGELCSLGNFRRQLRIIKQRFNVISVATLINTLRGKTELPVNPIILTFDDGTKEQYQIVFPLLQEMGLTATFFVLTAPLMGRIPATFKLQLIFGKADRDTVRYEIFPQALRKHNLERYLENIEFGLYTEPREIGEVKWTCNVKMSPLEKDLVVSEMFNQVLPSQELEFAGRMFMNKNELIVLHKAGMTIGSHGINHHTLSILGEEDLKRELSGSKCFLEGLLGSQVTCIGYPAYQPPKDIKKVKEAGYVIAFTGPVEPSINLPPYDIFAIKRIHEKDLEKEFLS